MLLVFPQPPASRQRHPDPELPRGRGHSFRAAGDHNDEQLSSLVTLLEWPVDGETEVPLDNDRLRPDRD